MMYPNPSRKQIEMKNHEQERLEELSKRQSRHDAATEKEELQKTVHSLEMERLNKNLAFNKEVEEKIQNRRQEAQTKKDQSNRLDAFSGMADVERTLVRLGLDSSSSSAAAATGGDENKQQQQQQQKTKKSVSLPALIHAENMKGVVLGGQTKQNIVSDSDRQLEAARRARQDAQANDEKLSVIRQKKEDDEQNQRDRIKRQYILDVEAGKAAAELRDREERTSLLLRARNLFNTERDKVFDRLKMQANSEVEKLMTERFVRAQAALVNSRAMSEEEVIIETAKERRRLEVEKFTAERGETRIKEQADEEIQHRENSAFANALVSGIVNISWDIIAHNETMMMQSHSGTPHDPISVSSWRALCDHHLGEEVISAEETAYIENILEAEKGEIQQEEENADSQQVAGLSPAAAAALATGAVGSRLVPRGPAGTAAASAELFFSSAAVKSPTSAVTFAATQPYYEAPHCCIARNTIMKQCPGLAGQAKTITLEEKQQFRAATIIDGALTRTIEHELQDVSWRDAQSSLNMLKNSVEENTDSKQNMRFLPTVAIPDDEPPCGLVLVGAENFISSSSSSTSNKQQQSQTKEETVAELNLKIAEFNNSSYAGEEQADEADENAASSSRPPMKLVQLNRDTMSGQDILETLMIEATSWSEGQTEYQALCDQFGAPAINSEGSGAFYGDGGGSPDHVSSTGGGPLKSSGTTSSSGKQMGGKHGASSANALLGGGGNKKNAPGNAGGNSARDGSLSGSTTGRSTGRRGNAAAAAAAAAEVTPPPQRPKTPDLISFDAAVNIAMGFELFARHRYRRVREEYEAAVVAKTEEQMSDVMVQFEEEERKRFLRSALGKSSAAAQVQEAAEARQRLDDYREAARERAIESIPAVEHRPWTLFLITSSLSNASTSSKNTSSTSTTKNKFEHFESLSEAIISEKNNSSSNNSNHTEKMTTPRIIPAPGSDFSSIAPLQKNQVIPPHFVPSSSSTLRVLFCTPNDITARTNRAVKTLNSARKGATTSQTTVSDIFRFVLREVEEERETHSKIVLLPGFGPSGAVHGELHLQDLSSLPEEIVASLSSSSSSSSENSSSSSSSSWYRCAPSVYPAPDEEVKEFSEKIDALISTAKGSSHVGHHTTTNNNNNNNQQEESILFDFVGSFRGMRDAEILSYSKFSQAADGIAQILSKQWDELNVDVLASFGSLIPTTPSSPQQQQQQQQIGSGRIPVPPSFFSKNASSSSSSPNNNTNRAKSPPIRVTPFLTATSNNEEIAQIEVVRHRLWQWFDNQRTKMTKDVSDQLEIAVKSIREMAILFVRAACASLRSLVWVLVRGTNCNGSSGEFSRPASQSAEFEDNNNNNITSSASEAFSRFASNDANGGEFEHCSLSLWTGITEELEHQLPSVSDLGVEFMHTATQSRKAFQSVLPQCKNAIKQYANLLIQETCQLSGVPNDAIQVLLLNQAQQQQEEEGEQQTQSQQQEKGSETWQHFLNKFFETMVGSRIEFLEQTRETLANASRKWLVYTSDKYRAALQSGGVLRAAVFDVKRAVEVMNNNAATFALKRRRSSALGNSNNNLISPSSSINDNTSNFTNTVEPELCAQTEKIPRPTNAGILFALEDVMRVSCHTGTGSSSPMKKEQQQQQQHHHKATKSADQKEIEEISEVVERQLFRDDDFNIIACGTNDKKESSNKKQNVSPKSNQQQQQLPLQPPNLKFSSLHLRFLLLHFYLASSSISSSSSSSEKNNNKKKKSLWTFVNEPTFIHAMLSSQICTMGRVFHITSPFDQLEKMTPAQRRRNRLTLPTCQSSAFSLFVPSIHWWGSEKEGNNNNSNNNNNKDSSTTTTNITSSNSAIQDAILCVRKGIPSILLNSNQYTPGLAYQNFLGTSSSTTGNKKQQQQQQKRKFPIPTLPIVQSKSYSSTTTTTSQQKQNEINEEESHHEDDHDHHEGGGLDDADEHFEEHHQGEEGGVGADDQFGGDGFEVLLGQGELSSAGVVDQNASMFMENMDAMMSGDGDGDGDSWFESMNPSSCPGSKPGSATAIASSGSSKPATAQQQQQEKSSSSRQGTVAFNENSNKPVSATSSQQRGKSKTPQQQQQPKGAALLSSLHREKIVSLRSSNRLHEDFMLYVSTSRNEQQSNIVETTTSSKQQQQLLPLELLFTTLLFSCNNNNNETKTGGDHHQQQQQEIIRLCTISDTASVVRRLGMALIASSAFAGNSNTQDNNSPHTTNRTSSFASISTSSVPGSPTSNTGNNSSSSSLSVMHETVRSLKIGSVRELASLPCFPSKSSISTASGPAAELCTLWDILSGTENIFSKPMKKLGVAHCWKLEKPVAMKTFIPFTQMLPLLSSDEAYLSRCERRFVMASCLNFPSITTTSTTATNNYNTPNKQPSITMSWSRDHTYSMDLLSEEGLDAMDLATAQAPTIDSASIHVTPEAFSAVFLDEPFDPIIMQLVIRGKDDVTYHGNICSLWGQEAWERVNPRCLPPAVW